jgi:hypothetical protein
MVYDSLAHSAFFNFAQQLNLRRKRKEVSGAVSASVFRQRSA